MHQIVADYFHFLRVRDSEGAPLPIANNGRVLSVFQYTACYLLNLDR